DQHRGCSGVLHGLPRRSEFHLFNAIGSNEGNGVSIEVFSHTDLLESLMLDFMAHPNSRASSWQVMFNHHSDEYVLGFEHIPPGLDSLTGGRAPGLRFSIDFLERMNDVLLMQRDIRLAKRCTVAGVKGSVPLLVLIAKTDHHEIAVLNQSACTNRIDFCRLMVAPELVIRLAQVIASSIASGVIGHRRCEYHVQASGLRTTLNFVAPIGMDLTGKIDIKTHDYSLL